MMQARAYQTEAIDKVRSAIVEGFMSIVLALPTGGGKTVIASLLILSALQRGSRILFVAHRRELIAQTYRKLLSIGVPASQIGIIMGSGRIATEPGGPLVSLSRPMAQIQIASIDTLRNRALPPADIVFIDECHRCLSPSYVKLKESYPNAIHLGLTATPYRNGGKGLGTYYQTIVVGALPSQLIAEGWIVDPRVWTVPDSELPDLSGVKLKGGDYDDTQLAEACNKKQLVGSIVEHYKEKADGLRAVAFAVNVEHSMAIARDFCDAGIAAEHLDGETPAGERDAILARLDRGETMIVSNCGVLTEGWDQPSVKCCILARPTRSTGLYLQMAGRILRPWEGKGAIILDHAGCALEHGLPSEDREFSLGDQRKKKLKSDDDGACSTKTCPECFAIVASACATCPECDHEFAPMVAKPLDQVDGKLVEITREQQAERRAFWDSLLATREANNYKPGWCAVRYRERFGVWPPKSFPKPTGGRPMSADEQKQFRDRLVEQAAMRGYSNGWAQKVFDATMAKQRAQFGTQDEASPSATVEPKPPLAKSVDPSSKVKWAI